LLERILDTAARIKNAKINSDKQQASSQGTWNV
jgi:hypothetical protein